MATRHAAAALARLQSAKRMTRHDDNYEVSLPLFEGPFDLLLFFIERDELDIHDIPISQITSDFLAYLHNMQDHKIEVAAEFIVVAAQLMKIKARMLLPRPELNAQGEVVDPRQTLVDRLLLYKRYKEAVQELSVMEDQQLSRYNRVMNEAERRRLESIERPEDELVGLTLFQLQRAFQRVMKRFHDQVRQPTHVIEPYPFTVEQVRDELVKWVARKRRVGFDELIRLRPDRIYVVFAFLIILDLVQYRKLNAVIGEGFNNFWVEEVGEELMAEPASVPEA
jgi:segregation and condensation protein A